MADPPDGRSSIPRPLESSRPFGSSGSRPPRLPPLALDDELDGAPRLSIGGFVAGNLPRRRPFVGREEEIAAIDEALASRVGLATLSGPPGIGKTAIALEVAHRFASSRSQPAGVWWLSASGRPADALARLVASLRTAGSSQVRAQLATLPPSASNEDLALAVRLALQTTRGPMLLVLDGLDHPGWKPHLPGGEVRVLATVRDDRFGLGPRTRVVALREEPARALATTAGAPVGEPEAKALDRVSSLLAGLPVAIESASLAVSGWARSWVDYERHLFAGASSLLGDRDPQGDYEMTALEAIDASIANASPGSLERRLLEGAAVFAPARVPIAWAASAAGGDSTSMEGRRALASLRAVGAIELDDAAGRLSIHPLVHRRLREITPAADQLEHERRGASCVMAWLEETVDPTRTAEVEARRAHIDEGLAAAERAGSDLVWLILADRLAAHLRHMAAYPDARSLLERAVIRAERLHPPDPSRVAETVSALASLLRDLGLHAEARPCLERALALAESTFGPRHPAVARDLSLLASTLRELGLAKEAKPLLERALAIDEETNGRDNPNTVKTLSTLAAVLKDLGQTSAARAHLERALAIEEKAFGPDHPGAVVRLTNLAMVLKDMGQAREARPLLQRALSILEATYGGEHPIVATSLTNLALVLKDLGLASEAAPLLYRANRIAALTLPDNHPTRAKIAAHLAHTLPPPPRRP